MAFLREQLAAGPMDRYELVQAAHKVAITLRTLERAKAELGVRSEQRREHGENIWSWRLPG